MRNRVPIALSVAALVVAVLGATPAVEAAKRLVLPRGSVTTAHIRNGTILPADLSPKTIRRLTVPPTPARARGVAVSLGSWPEQFAVRGANLEPSTAKWGEVLAQIRYAGGLACPIESVRVEGAFFDGKGRIVGTAGWIFLDPVPEGVWLPMRLLGEVTRKPARAELVLTSVEQELDCEQGQ